MWNRGWSRPLLQRAYKALSGHEHPRTVRVGDRADLRSAFQLIDCTVPPRGPRHARQHDAREWFCLRRYLLPLAEHGTLAYPFVIRKGQSPDFMFHWPDGSASGLEVTEATTEALQRALSLPDTGATELPGDRWGGDALEAAIRDAALAAIERKLAKMRRPGWRLAARQDLLLYANGWIAKPNASHLSSLLRAALAEAATDALPCGRFGTVSLITGNTLLHDVGGTCAVLPYDPAWD